MKSLLLMALRACFFSVVLSVDSEPKDVNAENQYRERRSVDDKNEAQDVGNDDDQDNIRTGYNDYLRYNYQPQHYKLAGYLFHNRYGNYSQGYPQPKLDKHDGYNPPYGYKLAGYPFHNLSLKHKTDPTRPTRDSHAGFREQ